MKIELCAASELAVRLSVKYNFDRIELCQQLEVGGLTPSIGFQQFASKLIETHVLIRPRAGNFIYNDDEKEVILKDISASLKIGVSGIVVGSLTSKNELDVDFLKAIKKESKRGDLVFHRAFDEVKDWKESMETLVELGFDRILTAGQSADVLAGLENLKEMISFSKDRIKIIAGGGVNKDNIGSVKDIAKPESIHFSATILQAKNTESKYSIDMLVPDEILLKSILQVMNPIQNN